MHVALLTNTAWLDEELAMFRYMVVGLMDENVRVVQVVPDKLDEDESSQFGSRLSFKDSPWSFLRTHRLGKLAGDLQELGVNLIHAMDGRLWPAAIKLAKKLQCPAVLTANSHLDVPLAQKLLKQHAQMPIGIAASTQPLADAIASSVQAQHVMRLIHPGVHVPKTSVKASEASGALCAVISGANEFDSEYESLFIGLAPIVTSFPQAQFFLDGQGHDQHLIWQAAQKLGLLANISLVPRRLGHRELLLGADVLIHPQPMGRSRGLTLQAMSRGIPILAHDDHWLDYLLDDQTAWLINRPHPELWTTAIERVLRKPAESKALGERAKQWVGEHHLASDHVQATINFYQTILGESFKFPGTA